MEAFELKICFPPKKRSQFYDDVARLAKCFEHCDFHSDGLSTITLTKNELLDKFDHVLQLLNYIRRWKETRILFNDRSVGWNEIRNKIIGADCYQGYENEIIQEIYCWQDKRHLGWSCKQLTEIRRYYNETDDIYRKCVFWFEFGHLIDDVTWQIDKNELRRLLKREAEIKHLYLCPLFDLNKVLAEIDKLPSHIDIGEETEWQVSYIRDIGAKSNLLIIRPKEIQ